MPEVTGSNGAHYAAYSNNIETLLHILANERSEMVHEPDGNGWLPIHEVSFPCVPYLDLICTSAACTQWFWNRIICRLQEQATLISLKYSLITELILMHVRNGERAFRHCGWLCNFMSKKVQLLNS
jgi:hypothetical protein